MLTTKGGHRALAFDAELVIVQDHPHCGQLILHRRGEDLTRHIEGAVTSESDGRPRRIGRDRTEDARGGPAHFGHARGDVPGVGLVDLHVGLGVLHHVTNVAEDPTIVTLDSFANLVGEAAGMDRISRAGDDRLDLLLPLCLPLLGLVVPRCDALCRACGACGATSFDLVSQISEKCLGVGHDAELDGIIASNFLVFDIDLDDLGLWHRVHETIAPVAGVVVREPRSHGQQHVGVARRLRGGVSARTPHGAKAQTVRLGHHALGGQRRDKGHRQQFEQSAQRGGGPG